MRVPSDVPVMTLTNVILFPHAMLPLHIFEPRYRRMLRDALASDRMFAVALQKPGRTREIPSPVAGLGLIRVAVDNRDGTSNLILQGLTRIALGETVHTRPYRRHRIQPLPLAADSSVEADALAVRVMELVDERLAIGFPLLPSAPPGEAGEAGSSLPGGTADSFVDVLRQLAREDSPEQLVDLVSATLLPDPRQRQVILETADIETRLRHLVRFLVTEIRRRRNPEA